MWVEFKLTEEVEGDMADNNACLDFVANETEMLIELQIEKMKADTTAFDACDWFDSWDCLNENAIGAKVQRGTECDWELAYLVAKRTRMWIEFHLRR